MKSVYGDANINKIWELIDQDCFNTSVMIAESQSFYHTAWQGSKKSMLCSSAVILCKCQITKNVFFKKSSQVVNYYSVTQLHTAIAEKLRPAKVCLVKTNTMAIAFCSPRHHGDFNILSGSAELSAIEFDVFKQKGGLPRINDARSA